MIVVVCSGGPSEELCPFDRFLNEDVLYIGADRGAYYLYERGIRPDLMIGDFDSITLEERAKLFAQNTETTVVAAEKDETDTDLALFQAIAKNPEKIILTGVTGGRLDHYEAVMRTVCHLQAEHPHITFEICNKHNTMRFLTPGTHSVVKDELYPYLSFFAYNERVENMTLRGVKYETTNDTIELFTSRFTSNEIVQVAHITFTAGICLMIRSAD